MTKAEAERLKVFKHGCTCGGFASHMNDRQQEQPHMTWCPQHDEYGEWYRALYGASDQKEKV